MIHTKISHFSDLRFRQSNGLARQWIDVNQSLRPSTE